MLYYVFLPVFSPQGCCRADRPGGGAAGSLLLIWGPVVPGRGPMGPGSARLGGAEGLGTMATGLHAESHARPCHTAPDAGPQWQDADGAVSQSPAPGAGDGGHLQRFHPVGVPFSCPSTHMSANHITLMCIFCPVSICHHLFQPCLVHLNLDPVFLWVLYRFFSTTFPSLSLCLASGLPFENIIYLTFKSERRIVDILGIDM